MTILAFVSYGSTVCKSAVTHLTHYFTQTIKLQAVEYLLATMIIVTKE